MDSSVETRFVITEMIGLHGHLVDTGALDRLDEVLTDDVVYDVEALGGGTLRGLEAVVSAALALGDGNPVAHHVTNIVVTDLGHDRARAVSKGFGVLADGSTGSVVYEDSLRRTPAGWRIAHRTVRPRRVPLTP